MATIAQFPHTVDLTSPGAVINGAGSVSAENGIGYGGTIGLRIYPPVNGQDRAGYTQHDFPATKTLHIRQIIKAVTPLPSCKWLVARRFTDPNHMDETTDLEGCGRFMGQTNPYINGRFVPWISQGVCSSQRDSQDQFIVAHQCDFDWNLYIGQHVCIEYAADLDAGTYRVYISTEDGVYSNSLLFEINIATGAPYNPENDPQKAEQVPSPTWFGSFDPMYWNNPAPAGTECILSGMVVSDAWIGSPFTVPVPIPDPTPIPSVLAPAYTGGRFHVIVNDVELSWHTQEKEAYEAAGRFILNNPTATVTIQTDVVRVTLE